MTQACLPNDPRSCHLGDRNTLEGVPGGFRQQLATELACALVQRILDADSLALTRFKAGQTTTVNVPLLPPSTLHGSPEGLADARRRSISLGAYLRPCLLAEVSDLDLLHEYQTTGAKWLVGRTAAVLADDMGLGKTAQAISALRILFNKSPDNTALVLCPKQLMPNWENEFRKWAPELHYVRLTPPSRWKSKAWRALFNRAHILITNYEQASSLSEITNDLQFSTVILDEAHRVRNAAANLTSDIRSIHRDRTWALTGTPLERAPSDVWTILSIVEPRRFNLDQMPSGEGAIRSRARPFVLRRMKKDVLAGLPPEIDTHETLELLPKQRASYDLALKSFRSAAEGQVLTWLTKLRQICDLDETSGESSKLERIVDILHTVHRDKEKAVVFSHLLNPLDELEEALRRAGISCATLTGRQGLRERESVLDRFQRDAGLTALLASTAVAGVGINLVEANHVVFVNRWWNPSANQQAKDRVSRMGQTRSVVVHSFTCRDTVEEVLDGILQEKKRLATAIVESLADPIADSSLQQAVTSRLMEMKKRIAIY